METLKREVSKLCSDRETCPARAHAADLATQGGLLASSLPWSETPPGARHASFRDAERSSVRRIVKSGSPAPIGPAMGCRGDSFGNEAGN
jgi:hypothetical protein